ncbi:hypothetical protein EJ04DRAFT_288068 [Polyplosphaeria fusca]|uniref:Uncharacterized protein n=1 Tax=Polyplosphaeria fusca TaxID=682080 RepID=A0A9P4RA50_9PLEO|nr:hypothetical protein EJ04DRAFT_288068 [Polyplosphaeria fusca]
MLEAAEGAVVALPAIAWSARGLHQERQSPDAAQSRRLTPASTQPPSPQVGPAWAAFALFWSRCFTLATASYSRRPGISLQMTKCTFNNARCAQLRALHRGIHAMLKPTC